METKVDYNNKIKETVSNAYQNLAKQYGTNVNEINSLNDCYDLYRELIEQKIDETILSNIREINKLLYKNRKDNYSYLEQEFKSIVFFSENLKVKIVEEERVNLASYKVGDSLKELIQKFEVNFRQLFNLVFKSKDQYYNTSFATKDIESKIRNLKFQKILTNIEFDNLFDIVTIERKINNNTSSDLHEEQMRVYLSLVQDNYNYFEKSQNYSIDKENNLLEILSYLADTSKEAIVNSDQFNSFKKYIHVKRQIEKEFIDLMEENVGNRRSSLTLLCGNVGDGKSHLLAFSKDKYPELFSQIDIHNDATESIKPELTAIDTLEIILKNFNDNLIENTNQHLVLAINVGVLNNFIQEMKKKNLYQKLTQFVEDSGLFDSSLNYEHKSEHFHLVSFLNNSSFEISYEGSESIYYDNLFNKIFSENENNPFYKAYLKDRQEKKSAQHNYNFEIMLNKNVQQTIKYLLIRTQIEYKNIISTRALFNFIYDIIVPSEDAKEKITGFLPYLLFENKEKSPILNSISKLDPVNIQNNQIDQLNIELYNTNNYLEKVKSYFVPVEFELVNQIFSSIGSENIKTHKKNMSGFLRLKFLFNYNHELFADKSYNTFMEYLSLSKKGESINPLAALVRDSVYIWNGSPKKYHLFINSKHATASVAIAVEIILNFRGVIATNNTNYNILLKYAESTNNQKDYEIEIDYKLFKLLYATKKGYILKEFDKKQGINFTEFIEEIINNKQSLFKTIVLDKDTGVLIELTNNGIEYEIERV